MSIINFSKKHWQDRECHAGKKVYSVKSNLIKPANSGKVLGLSLFVLICDSAAASKNVTRMESGRKRLDNNQLTLLV